MKYLSVCSGIEAASVAWESLGWEPVAFSEIEPFPSAVLAERIPDVPNLGDMTRYEQWNIPAINLLVGGTPCQAFSVAGKRGSLADDRGNLCLTFCRMADHFKPKWVLWENVPGVLSTPDNAFGCFLGALCGADAPVIPPVGMSDQEIFRQRGAYLVPDVAPSVTSKWAKGTGGPAGDECQNLVVFENHAQDSRVREMGDVFSTVSAKYGTGGGNTPIVVFTQNDAGRDASIDVAPTLRSGHGGGAVNQCVAYNYVVRRLTPRECERLQGFPDDWTLIPWRGKPAADCPDSHRYKAVGNSMAVPVMWYIGRRIQIVERRMEA